MRNPVKLLTALNYSCGENCGDCKFFTKEGRRNTCPQAYDDIKDFRQDNILAPNYTGGKTIKKNYGFRPSKQTPACKKFERKV